MNNTTKNKLINNWFQSDSQIAKILNTSLTDIKKLRTELRDDYSAKYNRQYSNGVNRKAWSMDEVLFLESNINIESQHLIQYPILNGRTRNDINQKRYYLKKAGGHFKPIENDIRVIDNDKIFKIRQSLINNDFKNKTANEIAEKLNVSNTQIHNYLTKYNTPYMRKSDVMANMYLKIAKLAKNHTIAEVSEILNKSYDSISNIAKNHNIIFKHKDADLIKEYSKLAKTHTINEATKALNISYSSLYFFAKRHNIKFRSLLAERLKVYSKMAKKYTLTETAKMLNESYSSIYDIANRNNIKFKKRTHDKLNVYSAMAKKYTLSQTAKILNESYSKIYYVAKTNNIKFKK